jgi:hypothetical protein
MYILGLGEFVNYSRPERFWLMTSWLGPEKSLTYFYSVFFPQFCVISVLAASGTEVRIRFAARSNFPLGLHYDSSDTHCKKRLATFPSPAGMSLNQLSLAGNNSIIPGQGELG